MKRKIFLLIGILALSVACQDNFVEFENDLTVGTKSAKYEKTKTHLIKGWIKVIPDWEAPMFTCTPEEFGIELCSSGWVSGHESILGKIVQEQSTYEKQSCDVTMTDEGPVVLNVVTADLLRTNGNRTFILSHTYINVATNEVWGYTDLVGGTGRFEGITGRTFMQDGSLDPETGMLSWEQEGYITLVIK